MLSILPSAISSSRVNGVGERAVFDSTSSPIYDFGLKVSPNFSLGLCDPNGSKSIHSPISIMPPLTTVTSRGFSQLNPSPYSLFARPAGTLEPVATSIGLREITPEQQRAGANGRSYGTSIGTKRKKIGIDEISREGASNIRCGADNGMSGTSILPDNYGTVPETNKTSIGSAGTSNGLSGINTGLSEINIGPFGTRNRGDGADNRLGGTGVRLDEYGIGLGTNKTSIGPDEASNGLSGTCFEQNGAYTGRVGINQRANKTSSGPHGSFIPYYEGQTNSNSTIISGPPPHFHFLYHQLYPPQYIQIEPKNSTLALSHRTQNPSPAQTQSLAPTAPNFKASDNPSPHSIYSFPPPLPPHNHLSLQTLPQPFSAHYVGEHHNLPWLVGPHNPISPKSRSPSSSSPHSTPSYSSSSPGVTSIGKTVTFEDTPNVRSRSVQVHASEHPKYSQKDTQAVISSVQNYKTCSSILTNANSGHAISPKHQKSFSASPSTFCCSTGTSSSSLSPSPPLPKATSQDKSLKMRLRGPKLVYPQHFHKGSIIQLSDGALKRVEDLSTEDFVKSAEQSGNLRIDSSTVVRIEAGENSKTNEQTIILSFAVGINKLQVSAETSLEHPLFVIGKGWSSCCPNTTFRRFSLRCRQLSVGDVCLSLTHASPTGSGNGTGRKRRHSESDITSTKLKSNCQ